MSKLKSVVASAMNTKITKKADTEKIKTFLSDKVLSINPTLLLSLSKLENIDKYDLDFSVSDSAYIEYGIETEKIGVDSFEIKGKLYDAKIDGFINYYNKETDTEGEIEVSIPLNIDSSRFDIYVKNNFIKLTTIEIEEDGSLIITFMG